MNNDASSTIRFAYDDIGWSPDGSRQREALADIAAFGFRGFETISQRLKPYLEDPEGVERGAARFKDLLDSHGLHLVCTTGATDEIARFVRALGASRVMVGVMARERPDAPVEHFDDVVERLNEQGRRMADQGIRLGVHPAVWTKFARPEEIRAILDRTDPRYVGFIPDIGQITLGGGDPVELCREYADRLVHVHLSDTAPEYRGGRLGHKYYGYQEAVTGHHMRDLGTGGVDFPGLLDAMKRSGYRGWATIETYMPIGSARESCESNKRYIEDVLGETVG
jgi:sugar phosphate isomerase/epimerase